MSKEFIWHLELEGQVRPFKVVVHENEIVTYEGDTACQHIPITNPESKQGVLQIDTVTAIFGKEYPIQLERGIPYIRVNQRWHMSETTYEERKVKLLRTHKTTAIVMCVLCLAMCLAVLIKYLVSGTMGDWWFLIVLGTLMGATGLVQYYDIKNQVAQLNEAEAKGE